MKLNINKPSSFLSNMYVYIQVLLKPDPSNKVILPVGKFVELISLVGIFVELLFENTRKAACTFVTQRMYKYTQLCQSWCGLMHERVGFN